MCIERKRKTSSCSPANDSSLKMNIRKGQVLYADEVIRHYNRNGRSFISVVVGESIAVAMD